MDTPHLPHAPLIDEAVLEEMAAVIRPAELARILQIFVEDTAARVDRVRRAALADDLRALADECHDLASTLGTFGAASLMTTARSVMEAAKAGEAATVHGLLPELLAGIERMTAMLKSRVGQNGRAEG